MTGYCPYCRRSTTIDSHGRCSFTDCDQVVLGGTLPPREAERHAGKARGPELVTLRVLREAYDLYLEGFSMRRVAAIILDRTGYKNERSCANCLGHAWRGLGWPLRDRAAACRATSYRHGLARDRDHRLALRYARGEIRNLQCAATKTRYGKGRGEQCQRPAQRGGAYCASHDPARAAERREHLAKIRTLRA